MTMTTLSYQQEKGESRRAFISANINAIGLLVVIALLYLVFSIYAPGFISLSNQMNVLRDAATIGIAAWAMTLVIIAGEIDVSVGPTVAFVSVCLAYLMQAQVAAGGVAGSGADPWRGLWHSGGLLARMV
ncbi:ribose/xylose/arabinose/galactoside ABC-type transport system permease subunit [Ewingella americana]